MIQSMLDEVSEESSALEEGQQLGVRAASVGFDWETALEALAKVQEEVAELRTEIVDKQASDDSRRDRLEDEIGDVLFAVANVARKLGVDAEVAMQRTNRKFRERFAQIEAAAAGQNRPLEDLSLEEMERIWQEAK